MTSSGEHSPPCVLDSQCAAVEVPQNRQSLSQHQPVFVEKKLIRTKSVQDSNESCRVCGDGHARMHYGVLTCFGCKGFFRRTLKRPREYACRHQENCVVDRHERNSCRFCRFKRCLEVGMDPKAVRPDRDATGRHYQGRSRRAKINTSTEVIEDGPLDDDWIRKLPVDMRTTLMQLMNIELLVSRGDSNQDAKSMYPLPCSSLGKLLDDPTLLDGKRTEIRHEPYRKAQCEELPAVAYRSLIAVIDWVDHLFDIVDLHSSSDKQILVKNGFAPLSIFTCAASTARSTKDQDILCLCNFGYVPKDLHRVVEDCFHLGNRLVERTIDELVNPFRGLNMTEEEVVLLKAIILLNPYLKCLSHEAMDQIADFRDRIQETLYHVVRETHPKEVASSRFGNLLLFLPNITILGNLMCENLQYVRSFGNQQLNGLFVELLDDTEEVDAHDKPMRHSQSSASVSSLATNGSSSSFDSYDQSSISSAAHSDQSSNISDSRFNINHNDDEMNGLSTGMNTYVMTTTASSLPNLDVLSNCMLESDPEYNMTLTPDMFPVMRQASFAQSMEVDGNCETANYQDIVTANRTNIEFSLPNSPDAFTSRANFYIDPNVSDHHFRNSIETQGARHKFTVTKTNTSYPVPRNCQHPHMQHQCENMDYQMQNYPSMQQHQQFHAPQYQHNQTEGSSLSRTQSFPYQQLSFAPVSHGSPQPKPNNNSQQQNSFMNSVYDNVN